jgi:lipopolysaccharide/colanic/teichoic acid biosynthesis glycosyltransferase
MQMTSTKLLARRHRRRLQEAPAGPFGLEPAQWFHHSLKRERARADRSGRALALVLFTPRERRRAKQTNARLAKLLRRRLRPTDEAGWFDDERLAVLLPEASAADAWKVADDLCLGFPLRATPPLCEVFVYPSDELPEGDRGHRCEKGDGSGGPTRRLEEVFVRPLPPWKRAVDVLGAVVGLVFVAPLLLVLAAFIKLESTGPVLFRQRRAGQGGRPFTIYKLRTMTADAEEQKGSLLALNEQDGPAFKIKADPRVTRFGRWLRTTSLDELPQLWNVLKGEMSLVGPRPLPCNESAACLSWQRRRLDVTPGLTCIWQVRGRSRVSFDEWMRMDLQYVDSLSPARDLHLLLATVGAVVRRAGAH